MMVNGEDRKGEKKIAGQSRKEDGVREEKKMEWEKKGRNKTGKKKQESREKRRK